MADGVANGVPLLPPDLPLALWQQTMAREFEVFVRRVDADETTVLDPYGASGAEEFFAVASESFFVNPVGMQAEHAELYALLRRFYDQDPAVDTPGRRRS